MHDRCGEGHRRRAHRMVGTLGKERSDVGRRLHGMCRLRCLCRLCRLDGCRCRLGCGRVELDLGFDCHGLQRSSIRRAASARRRSLFFSLRGAAGTSSAAISMIGSIGGDSTRPRSCPRSPAVSSRCVGRLPLPRRRPFPLRRAQGGFRFGSGRGFRRRPGFGYGRGSVAAGCSVSAGDLMSVAAGSDRTSPTSGSVEPDFGARSNSARRSIALRRRRS